MYGRPVAHGLTRGKSARRCYHTAGDWESGGIPTMATTPRDKNPTAKLFDHMVLGIDGVGHVHHYDARAERVHVVSDAGRELTERVGDVDDWMAFVAERRGWQTREYGVGLDTILARALEGSG